MDSGGINCIVFLLIAGATVAQLIVKKFRKKKEIRGAVAGPQGPQEEEDEDEKEDPNKDLVDQLFGPYIERRKKEFAARQAAGAATVREKAPSAPSRPPDLPVAAARPLPSPSRPAPVRAAPARPARAPVASPAKPPPTPPSEPVHVALPPVHHHSLEARLFRNRSLSQGAKLVLASEILSRPKYFRR